MDAMTEDQDEDAGPLLGVQRIKLRFDRSYVGVGDVTLPERSVMHRLPGEIVQDGWVILFQWGAEDGVEYLDVYESHRMTNDSYRRIWETGEGNPLGARRDVGPPDGETVDDDGLPMIAVEQEVVKDEAYYRKWKAQLERICKQYQAAMRSPYEPTLRKLVVIGALDAPPEITIVREVWSDHDDP